MISSAGCRYREKKGLEKIEGFLMGIDSIYQKTIDKGLDSSLNLGNVFPVGVRPYQNFFAG